MRSSLREGEKEPGCPDAGPVVWIATLKKGASSSKTRKRTHEIKAHGWKNARDEAMVFFGVEASELEELVRKEHSK